MKDQKKEDRKKAKKWIHTQAHKLVSKGTALARRLKGLKFFK